MTAVQFLPGLLALAALAIVAGVMDVREHRISNNVLLVALVAGIAWLGWVQPAALLSYGFAGLAVGLVLLLPFHIVGPMGAGDVKLAAVSGFFLGPVLTAAAVAAALILGGVVALVIYFLAAKNFPTESVSADSGAGDQGTISRPGAMLLPFGCAVGAGFCAVGVYQYLTLMGVL